FENAVLGWKWDAEGRLPTRWDPEELEARIGDLSKVMGSRNLRRHLYRFLSEIGEETVTHWFFSRASDPVPVALMDPETRMLRVRWMTSLDRLESILVNSDFRLDLFGHEFGVNYGLKFIGRFAEAWGDE